jgi:hypothetical protein
VNSADNAGHRANRQGEIDSAAVHREDQLRAGGTDLGRR